MAEQVKVFKNVVDQVVPVTATEVVLHTTSSTQRAVLKDLDCINLGAKVTLDLDGRTLNTGTTAGKLERTKSLIMGPSSILKLKFPAKDPVGFTGMFFFNGSEGINLVSDATVITAPSITSVSGSIILRTGGFVYKPLATDTPFYFAIASGVIYKHDETGTVVSSSNLGITGVHQMGTDGTYIYTVKSSTLLGRKNIATYVDTDITMTGDAMALPGHNQGCWTIYHDGKVYSKTTGGSTTVTICTIATGVVTGKYNVDFNVGSYDDGGCLVVNRAGVPFIVAQGTSSMMYWNLNTDIVTKIAGGGGSTEYGNGGCEVEAGVALIFGELSDRVTIIDTNSSVPSVIVYQYPNNPYQLVEGSNGSFGNSIAAAGGLVPIPQRTFSAYVAGIDITED